MRIREAIVVNNNDPDKTGKVQIRILPEMIDLPTGNLPWCAIYSSDCGFSSSNGKHVVLENNSLIRVLIEDEHFKKIRYISDDYVEGLYFYSESEGLTAITELSSQTYPQPTFHLYKDGTIEFNNSETGEHGTLFKSGAYMLHDSDGNIIVNSNTGKLKLYNAQTSIKQILLDLQEVVLGLVTPLNFIDSEGGPCTYTEASSHLPKMQQTLININNLMEDV